MNKLMQVPIAIVLALPPVLLGADAGEVRDLSFFLRRLRTLDHLPVLEQSHTALSSTWSREGAISDPNDFKRIEGRHNILLDVTGPGCIHRIFTGRLGADVAGTRIQIVLDRQPAPLFDLTVDELFDDRNGPIPYPLVFHKTYPGTLFPIPFEKHCLVRLVNEEQKNWGNFWQIAYTTYAPGTAVRSLHWPPTDTDRQEIESVCRTWLQAESTPPEPPSRWSVSRELNIQPGGTGEIELPGCGIIRAIQLAVTPSTPDLLKCLRMQMAWDGAAAPSVDVPLGCFFGHGEQGHTPATAYSSLLLGVTDQYCYTRFPMPFARGAAIQFRNTHATSAARLEARLHVEPQDTLPANFGRFHATWLEKRAVEPDAPRYGRQNLPVHIVFERTQGPGKYVGVLLNVAWPHEKEWWGEGDWMIWTDEDGWPPSYHGTGTEEYFNSGWCAFDRKAVSGYVTTRPGHEIVYSFHLNDAFHWRDRIRVAVETVGWREGDRLVQEEHPIWGTTAFWYAAKPP